MSLMPWTAIVHGFRPMRFYIREVRTRRNHGYKSWETVENHYFVQYLFKTPLLGSTQLSICTQTLILQV